MENSTHTVLPLKGERRVLHPFTTEGRCGLTVRPGPVTSACTTLGFLPVPSSTLHLSAWSAKGEKVCLTKGVGPTQAWTVHTTSFEPPESSSSLPGVLSPAASCHLPHPLQPTRKSRWPLPDAWISSHRFPPPSAQFTFCLSFEREALRDAYL